MTTVARATPSERSLRLVSALPSDSRIPATSPPVAAQRHRLPPPPIKISRRDAAALLPFVALVPLLPPPSPAAAFSLGISGPKDWLKEQKRKAAKYLLAPIDASRESLRSVYLALTAAARSDFTAVELGEIQNLLVSSARDCVPIQRNSFVAFQSNTGVEVCTFTLILKNAASLLDKNDPVKLEGEAILNDLISSFASLSSVVNGMDIQLSSDRLKVADAVRDTLSSLDKFEQGVKDCLEA